MDEDWIVSEARNCRLSDISAAKSWLIVGRTLFPRNADIQFEMYQLEKSHRNVREAAKVFEEMTISLPHEMRLWNEISAMSEALQSDSDDSVSVFYRDLFNALPSTLQHSMLLTAAESVTDTLHQCRLLLLVVDRYPGQVKDQGVKLVELLLQAEKVAKFSTPVNCYRKYLACNVLPMILRSGVPMARQNQFPLWLEKAIEFYLCYIAQPTLPADLPAGRVTGGSTAAIAGLTEKESNITDPWKQLYQLLQMVASRFQWKNDRVLLGDNRELQWQQLNALYENLCIKPADGSRDQLLYLSLVCFMRSLYQYASGTEMPQNCAGGALVGHELSRLVLVESFTSDFGEPSHLEHRSKKLKTEPEIPNISVSEGVTADTNVNFMSAYRYWRLLHSDLLKNDFLRLYQQWSPDCWNALQLFEIDASICQGLYQEALVKLQKMSTVLSTNTRLRYNLQMACCYCCLADYDKSCQLVIDIVSSLKERTESPRSASLPAAKSGRASGGRQLHLLSCNEADVMSYCISLLIACLKEKAWKTNMDDLLLGHMIVLAQYDWPKYESLFCDIVQTIKKRGQFAYNLFFSYVIDIDILEEFAFLLTPDGGPISFDIMPNSAKGTAQARTMTRGVNKVAKEDLKQSLERQVSRSHENVNNLIRLFLIDEAELLKQALST